MNLQAGHFDKFFHTFDRLGAHETKSIICSSRCGLFRSAHAAFGTESLAHICMLLIALFIKRIPQFGAIAKLHFTTITNRADSDVTFEF